MRVFAWIRPWRNRHPEPVVVDPWAGGGDTYVYRFRQRLDEIAEDLSRPGRVVLTRFNQELKCAELYEVEGKVLFQLQIHGEYSEPYKALLIKIPSDGMDVFLFLKRFPLPVEFSQNLSRS